MRALVPVADVGTEILDAFGKAVAVLFSFIPALIGALIILLIGWIVARVVRSLILRLLRAVRFDQVMQRTGLPELMSSGGVRADPANLLAGLVYWFIFLIFVVAAANALGVPTITSIVTSIVLFLPNVFVAVIILIIGLLLARFVADLVRAAAQGTGVAGARFIAGIVRWAIIAFAFILALNQLSISPNIIQTLFASVTFGLSLALALAFGLGGRETAKDIVDSTYESLSGRQVGRSAGNIQGAPPSPPPLPPSTTPPVPR
ncbi:MAG: mechanosensitive ion channel [Ktedonobacterales bacterium]